MNSKLTNFSKNLLYSISLTATNAGLSLLVWIIAPFFISPEDIGYGSLLLAIVFLATTLIENSFSTAIITFKLSCRKSMLPILVFNLTIWLVFMMFFFLFYKILNFNLGIYDSLIIILIPFLSSLNTILDNFNKLNLHFRENAVIEIFANILGFVFFVWTLTKRTNHLPLLIFPMAKYIIINVLHFVFTLKKINNREDNLKSNQDIFYFGLYILGEKIMTACISYADTFIISHQLGLKTLGVYELFKRVLVRPILLLTSSVENLALPYLSQLKKDATAFLIFYKSYVFGLSLLCFGILGITYFIKDIIFKVLPDLYSGYTSVFSLLLCYAVTLILLNPIDLILYSSQKSKIFFKWNAAYFLPLLLVVFFSASHGLDNMIVSVSVFYFILFFIGQLFIMNNFTFLKNNLFIKIGMIPFLLSALAFAIAFVIQITFIKHTALSIGASVLVYITSLIMLLRLEKNMINDVRSLLFKTSSNG